MLGGHEEIFQFDEDLSNSQALPTTPMSLATPLSTPNNSTANSSFNFHSEDINTNKSGASTDSECPHNSTSHNANLSRPSSHTMLVRKPGNGSSKSKLFPIASKFGTPLSSYTESQFKKNAESCVVAEAPPSPTLTEDEQYELSHHGINTSDYQFFTKFQQAELVFQNSHPTHSNQSLTGHQVVGYANSSNDLPNNTQSILSCLKDTHSSSYGSEAESSYDNTKPCSGGGFNTGFFDLEEVDNSSYKSDLEEDPEDVQLPQLGYQLEKEPEKIMEQSNSNGGGADNTKPRITWYYY
ncbi:MAG: hypothetical protein KIT27_11385 [Legionellales bacterium]|nr:hypothetical protein [Legionellales bacterium]